MADHRHKRDTNARRKPRAALVAGPLALVATASAVTIGVLVSSPVAGSLTASESASADLSAATVERRSDPVSRSATRVERAQRRALVERNRAEAAEVADLRAARAAKVERAATLEAVRGADEKQWTTTVLNLWSAAGAGAKQTGELESGTQVLVTGRTTDDQVEVVVDGASRWVTAGYLADEKPLTAASGLSMEPCPDPGVESGLTDDAVYVYRSVCAAFPQITSYGGWDGHGEHSSGKALDIMTSDVALGTAIAEFLQSHAGELNLYDILWHQQIWTPVRASEGWRSMSSRGSATANHFDHVHVAVN